MKLKFTIHYNTAWGESMHVDITYHSQDGTVRRQDIIMQTADGELWTLETAAMMSRHHPLSFIDYAYQVEDADGHVLRREWDDVPRCYSFDATKDYVFPDQWRDRPLPMHLYSKAYLTTTGFHAVGKDGAQPDGLLSTVNHELCTFRRTIVFRVSAPQLRQGQAVAVCGSHPAIGLWNPSRYLRMEPAGMGEWQLSVNAQGWLLPVEYKYVIVDDKSHELLKWEEGDNRTISAVGVSVGPAVTSSPTVSMPAASPDGSSPEIPDGLVLVLHGGHLRIAEEAWRAAGVAIPLFSLRSEHSYGVGDFGDLRRFVDWAVATGMKIVQLLPVNDTTTDGHWNDAHPYNIVSVFALHPHYVDLEAAGTLRSKEQMTQFLRRRQELNALPYSDYEAVDRVKNEYLRLLFEEQGNTVQASQPYQDFVAQNEYWLKPYAQWKMRNEKWEMRNDKCEMGNAGGAAHSSFTYFIQYLLHTQLKAAADYARSKGVSLKGDLPIGVSRNSVETHVYPELFHLDAQAGTPPDNTTKKGQNWGFPTYNWNEELSAGQLSVKSVTSLKTWFRLRLRHIEQYFDALRIDHVLGFFRIWEIPDNAVDGVLGHFSPALPLTVEEIEYFGLPFRKELFTRPFINDRLVERLFGMHAQYVRDNFLVRKAYGLYDLKAEYATQRKIAEAFADRRDENSLWVRDGLMQLVSNVLFVKDPQQPDMYHPRIGVLNEPVFEALSAEDKDAFMRLYNNYFFQRHSFFWGQQALKRLPDIMKGCHMLFCAEDLGMLPDCVEPVLDQLRILTLEIQQMPKHPGFEFAHLDANPIRSVCTISTHDMAPLRLWWQEQPERRQRFYVTMLQKEGRAPEQLPAHLAEEIIARHLYCPSMLCILQLQDWLAMDNLLRRKNPQEERINMPSDPFNRWQYRMHLTIEELLAATKFNAKLRTMIQRSKR